MPRFKLTIAYDGTDFCGWQKQEPFAQESADDLAKQRLTDHRPSKRHDSAMDDAVVLPVREGETRSRIALRTVQHVVEQTVRTIVREPVIVMGSSRTDAGVHARGQVASFMCSPHGAETADLVTEGDSRMGWPLSRGLDRLQRALNGRLPDDIQVTNVEHVPDFFNPIRHTHSKSYSYTIHVAKPPPRGQSLRCLWDRRYVHHAWDDLDADAMNAAAQKLVGEHDFVSFAASSHGRLTTVRTIFECRVSHLGVVDHGERIRIDVTGSGFLYHMVRIISGTLVEVGRGRMKPDDIPRVIAAKDRRAAGPTLPPTGLCLEWIRYPAMDSLDPLPEHVLDDQGAAHDPSPSTDTTAPDPR